MKQSGLVVFAVYVLWFGQCLGSVQESSEAKTFYCGQQWDTCIINHHVCLHDRCQKCSDFQSICFTSQHLRNCTTFCRGMVREELKKELTFKQQMCNVTKNVSEHSSDNNCTSENNGFSWVSVVVIVVVVGSTVQLLNILPWCCKLWKSSRKRRMYQDEQNQCQGQPLMTPIGIPDVNQTSDKQIEPANGDRFPIQEQGNDAAIDLHNNAQNSQDDFPHLHVTEQRQLKETEFLNNVE